MLWIDHQSLEALHMGLYAPVGGLSPRSWISDPKYLAGVNNGKFKIR